MDNTVLAFGSEDGTLYCTHCMRNTVGLLDTTYYSDNCIIKVSGETFFAVESSDAVREGLITYCDLCNKRLDYEVICVKNDPITMEDLGIYHCECLTCSPDLYLEVERSEY